MAPQIETLRKHPLPASTRENILVVKRDTLFADIGSWHGLNTTVSPVIMSRIEADQEFLPRDTMEMDQRYKQIIPYLLFCHNQQLFVMKRKGNASEQRLASKLSLGIGGHIRKEDMLDTSIISWAQREFAEEVQFDGNYNVTTLGVLNDDTNDVGKVHLGLVLLLHGSSDQITIKDEHKSCSMQTLDECLAQEHRFENWSAIILHHLRKHTTLLAL